jgi:hypothetical protein
MYAAASGKSTSDIPQSVAKRYIEETPREAYKDMPERRPAKRIVARRKKKGGN